MPGTHSPNASLRLWTRVPPDDGSCRLRVFCLPHAGGSASAFAGWQPHLPKHLHVCPIQLPARQNRLSEPPFTRVGPLVDTLADVLESHASVPFALFGHSMGGLVAFELARQLRRRHAAQPVALLIASCRAAHLPNRAPLMAALPDPAFLTALRTFSGVPESLLHNRELLELLLPTLRADVTLYESYAYAPEPPLACPIFVYGGRELGDVPFDELSAWRHLTCGPVKVQTFPGSHFFIEESQSGLLQAIQQDLADWLA